MSSDQTRKLLERYLASEHQDLSTMAEDVVFTTMGTGEEHHGREGVRRMLHHIYHVAFDARAELRTMVCQESHAVLEAIFVGRHTGEFAGVPATNREVRVPLCVVYDFRNDLIHRGRVYFELPVLLEQLGVKQSRMAGAH